MGRSPQQFEDDEIFEREVCRVARDLYGNTADGGTIEDGREYDGTFFTETLIVCIEATTSRSEKKALSDGNKLKTRVDRLMARYPDRGVRGYFITQEEPQPAQRQVIRNLSSSLIAMSFAEFTRRLFDRSEYLASRKDYAFGSARDPEDGSLDVRDKYIQMSLLELPNRTRAWSAEQALEELDKGRRILLTGEYGIGKSMTLREVFRNRTRHFHRNNSLQICIHLNLRDHQGQDDPAEALMRHATKIGFSAPTSLIRAWRGGFVHLMLDGFDEITFAGWRGKVSGLSEVRRRNVSLVRNFLEESPRTAGVLIAGRSHFFDKPQEMESALGLATNYLHLSASDFSDSQVRDYLGRRGWTAPVPNWLPSRPLLLGYLAARGVFEYLQDDADEERPAEVAWDFLLDQICNRESRNDPIIDGKQIRQIIERLASKARRTASGLGPLTSQDMNDAFTEICGVEPDEGSRVILDRLPGLGIPEKQTSIPSMGLSGSVAVPREFVDADLVDAARAGDVVAYVMQFNDRAIPEQARSWTTAMERLGITVSLHRLKMMGFEDTQIQAAHSQIRRDQPESVLALDLLQLVLTTGVTVGNQTIEGQLISHVYVPPGTDASGIVFRDCLVATLDLSDCDELVNMPAFYDCDIEQIFGVANIDAIPKDRYTNLHVTEFPDSSATIGAILKLNLTDSQKVMLTILKKLYRQSGGGRQEGSFYRGIDQRLTKYVPDCLRRLSQEGLAFASKRGGKVIWNPARGQQQRINQILDAPLHSNDPILQSSVS